MSDHINKPTSSRPIFVGTSEIGEILLRTLLVSLDAHVRDDLDLSGLPLQGELSQWVIEMYRAPLRIMNLGKWKGTNDESQAFRRMLATLGLSTDDPKVLAKSMQHASHVVTPKDAQRMLEARSKGDELEYFRAFVEVGKKASSILGFKPEGTITDPKVFLTGYGRRMRVHKLAVRCFAFHLGHPLTLIAKARRGDRQAVLDLIKADKMFLHDACTAKVIKEAELKGDRTYLRQVARAQQYVPRPRRTTRFRLLLYSFFNIARSSEMLGAQDIRLPSSAKLHLLLDPEGKYFKTNEALERFVERCRREWEETTIPALTDFLRTEGILRGDP